MTVLPPINWEKVRDFSSADLGGAITVTPDTSKGYDIEAVRRTPERTEEILASCNGVLSTEERRVRFFVNAIVVSTGMGNKRAQGRRIQDLYPRSFKMPTYLIQAQSLTQEDYGLLCEFVHLEQQDAVGSGKTLQLWVREGVPFVGLVPELYHAGIAGYHRPIEAEGFVLHMPRKHRRFEYTPKFEFEFSVVYSHAGIFQSALEPPNLSELENPEINKIIAEHEKPFSQAPGPTKPATPAAPQETLKGVTSSSGETQSEADNRRLEESKSPAEQATIENEISEREAHKPGRR